MDIKSVALCAFAGAISLTGGTAWAQTSAGAYTSASSASPFIFYTVSGDTDSSLPAPGKFEAATASSFAAPGAYRDQNGRPADGFASSFAYSNLATGKLGTFAASDRNTQANAQASYSDRINLAIAGVTADTVTTLRFLFTVDGIFSGDHTADPQSGGYLQFRTDVGYVNRPFGGIATTATIYENSRDQVSQASFNNTVGKLDKVGSSRFLTMALDVIGANPQLVIQAYMVVGGQRGITADFGHTAGLALLFPENVTYTSASGVFLTESTPAVPEPASWAMMIAGFGLVGGVARRRGVVSWRAV